MTNQTQCATCWPCKFLDPDSGYVNLPTFDVPTTIADVIAAMQAIPKGPCDDDRNDAAVRSIDIAATCSAWGWTDPRLALGYESMPNIGATEKLAEFIELIRSEPSRNPCDEPRDECTQ